MATPSIAPLTFRAMKELILTIDDTDYAMHTSSCDFTPASSAVTWRGGKPTAVVTDRSSDDWTVNLNVAQDFQNPAALCNLLLKNAGKKANLTFKPDAEGTFAITAEVTLVAPKVGGTVNTFNESTVSLPSGPPEITYPSATTPAKG